MKSKIGCSFVYAGNLFGSRNTHRKGKNENFKSKGKKKVCDDKQAYLSLFWSKLMKLKHIKAYISAHCKKCVFAIQVTDVGNLVLLSSLDKAYENNQTQT